MFDHFVWSVLVVPPLIVVAVRLVADRLRPATAAVVVAWSAAVAAVASLFNLALLTAKAIAQTPAVAAAFGLSPHLVAHDTAHVAWVPPVSAGLLVASVSSVLWSRHRRRRVLAAAAELLPGGGGPVVEIHDARAQAFAVPGDPGRIVVTTGMRGLLTGPQFEALLAHEHAHLDGRHHRLVALADFAASAHPALRWVARHVGYLVERAADERAAETVGSRRTVAHAIGVAALAGHAPVSAGLNAASSGGVTPRRVTHLLQPRRLAPPAWRLLPVLLAAASVVWTGEAAIDLVQLLTAARLV
ncbi:Zn-dependent protease with chaperone function [Allocatelliglobosispora scoriae]|uniref:Zn-dependent protease with chaperone function n=1 Tax=Allocatelliglobosispora scoriae TaxID=643052 RepID=A0A841C377_9ACTN|nr:M56 family metallopeptidase [Allocatelliglobosispora scoriae]MBB5874355.1 Zn-dependent protease with chaperone function [Allocatelliglobosispora scoriae]